MLNSPTVSQESGMETRVLNVDKKGRIHIPKELRERLGVKKKVRARIERGVISIEPITDVVDRLGREVKFNFKSVEEALPGLRRVAEEQLLQEV